MDIARSPNDMLGYHDAPATLYVSYLLHLLIRHLFNLYYLPYKEWNYSISHWSMPEEDKLTMSRFLEMHGGTCA